MLPSLHHLAFRTADVVLLAAFYREMLGLETARDEAPRSIWLALGGGAVLMIEKRGDPERNPAATSMELVALRVDDATKDAIRRRALSAGCYDGETAFTVYLRDPDGRRIGVSTYDFPA